MTLAALGEASGLSIGFLSQIERGLSDPTIKQLRDVSNALGVQIGSFFQAVVPGEAEGGIVVRAANRRMLSFGALGMTDYLLSPNLDGKLEMLACVMKPGAETASEGEPHAGEEAGYVLAGRLELWVEDQHFLLEEGDSFGFDSTRPHRYRNPGDTDATIIWVLTPPTY
jgi:quercetin dioxygenase-like cupin family protein